MSAPERLNEVDVDALGGGDGARLRSAGVRGAGGARGNIVSVAGHEMWATGLEDAGMHDVVHVGGEVPALVVALERDVVWLVKLVDASVAPGAPVQLRGSPGVRVDASMLGRVISGTELWQSGEGLADGPLFSAPRPRWGEPRRRSAFTTGLLVHDMSGELRRGDAILFSSRGVGRGFALEVGSEILRHQESAGAVCVFVRLRSSLSSLDARQLLQGSSRGRGSGSGGEAWSKTVFLEPGRDATPAASWLLCRAAIAVARAFAEGGADVVLLVDGFFDLGGMGVDRLPGFRRFAELAMLTSAADCHETGSLTVLVTGHGPAGTEYLQLFDRQLDLERTRMGNLAGRRSTFCRPPIRVEPMRGLGRILVAAEDADCARGFSTDDHRVRRGRRVQEVLRFQVASRLDLLEQTLCVLAVAGLDDLEVGDVVRFVDKYVQLLRQRHAGYLEALRSSGLVRDDPLEVWATVATEAAAALQPEVSAEPADSSGERPESGRPWWKLW